MVEFGEIHDIEDLVKAEDVKPQDRFFNKKLVTVRAKTKLHEIYYSKQATESYVPGTHKIYIKTWGCSHNNSDSEYMAGQLSSFGYQITNEKENADLWLLNSCTVKNPSEDTFRNEIEAGRRANKRVVVAGCVPQGAPRNNYFQDVSVVGVLQVDRVVEVVDETLKGHIIRLSKPKMRDGKRVPGPPLSLPKIRKNSLIEILPINSGCLNQCTYCKTKHARGNLASYTPFEIVERARQAFAEGCCEIWLTSEDTGAYGLDIGSSLPDLLWQIIPVIPDHCMLRVGMTNPPYILNHLEAMAEILQHPRVYSFLHVPVQSGSDCVLSDMKREYCRNDFESVISYLLKRVPNLSIATDIICGFPTETDEDFEQTMDLCTKYRFPSLFINQFFPRPGTPAAKMKRIPPQEVKKRTKRLNELFRSYEPFKGREGSIYKVLVTEVSHDKQYFVGHNKSYEQILLPMHKNLLGAWVEVRITGFSKFSMNGELVECRNKCDMSTVLKTKTVLCFSISFLAGLTAFLLKFFLRL